ncbi:xanthine phosphoribosyltransferase [Tannockella kyphosi]|uniref:xanthine phosphoribosyltransferase n=1 Tax=Tannockella kyphosi TaxID=2899121 RepID=UPI00201222D4|nr:xanthine phosphoribosyltransferase [Tannockella kyphosi]
MKKLEDKIISDGSVILPNIVKVDSFLNHQIDTALSKDIAEEFKSYYNNKKVTKVVTIEASGIAIALATAHAFDNVPVVFAKKGTSKIMNDTMYTSPVHSFTKNVDYLACIKKEFLTSDDHVLLVDDFLANGQAMLGLIDLCKQAGATISGIGIVIEKGFQDGRALLEKEGYEVCSLAIIDEINENGIVFK